MRNVTLLGCLLVVVVSSVQAQNTRPVRLTTPDDVGIVGTYYPTETENAPAVLLLHSYGATRAEWAALAPLLQRNGIAALAIDLRGHGESTHKLTANGLVMVNRQKFVAQDLQDMLLDINAAMDWLGEQHGINPKRIGIVASDLGASLALRYALFNEDLMTLVLFSPLLEYQGVRADDALKKLGPLTLRVFVSRDDVMNFNTCSRMLGQRKTDGKAHDDRELRVCSGSWHGASMLQNVEGLTPLVLGSLRGALVEGESEPMTAPPPVTLPAPPPAKTPATKTPKPAQPAK